MAIKKEIKPLKRGVEKRPVEFKHRCWREPCLLEGPLARQTKLSEKIVSTTMSTTMSMME